MNTVINDGKKRERNFATAIQSIFAFVSRVKCSLRFRKLSNFHVPCQHKCSTTWRMRIRRKSIRDFRARKTVFLFYFFFRFTEIWLIVAWQKTMHLQSLHAHALGRRWIFDRFDFFCCFRFDSIFVVFFLFFVYPRYRSKSIDKFAVINCAHLSEQLP